MQSRSSRNLIFSLIALFVLAGLAWAVVYCRADGTGQKQLEIEAAKSLLQLMAVAVIGNVVLLLIRNYEDRKKALTARRDLLRTDLSQDLGELYGKTKQIRRTLRAATDWEPNTLPAQKYSESLEELSDIQVKLEGLQSKAAAGARQRTLPAAVPDHLRSMERYLSALVSEYERSAHLGKDTLAIATTPILEGFMGKGVNSTFRAGYSQAYHEAFRGVESAIEADLR